jgi:GTP-binding protein
MLTIAIVGRPNVGKSTLFNRLAGKRLAIVHDTPGVTRDRREAEVDLGGRKVLLIDTAGFEEGPPASLAARMTAQTKEAVAQAALVLFVVDARDGITAGDETIAQALRKAGKPVVLVANKSEGRAHLEEADAFALGFGEALAVSAEHALGLDALYDRIGPYATGDAAPESEQDLADRPLRLALVGRPNVGKSSLFNRLLDEERALTSADAGTTRDAIAVPWAMDGRAVLLHDTAGMRKKARAAGQVLEQLSVESTLDAIRFADCVVVVLDAVAPFEKQDLAIADLVEKEGRAIVFAVNKWDLAEPRAGAIGAMKEELGRLVPQVAGAPLAAVSARTGEGLDHLKEAIRDADRAWNTRVPTASLNRFLTEMLGRHAPPAIHGRRIRVRYMTQPKSRPPTFALFGTQLTALPKSYLRYLANALRETFGLAGAPIRLVLRNSKNPYAEK